jgi:hypothetical protein
MAWVICLTSATGTVRNVRACSATWFRAAGPRLLAAAGCLDQAAAVVAAGYEYRSARLLWMLDMLMKFPTAEHVVGPEHDRLSSTASMVPEASGTS